MPKMGGLNYIGHLFCVSVEERDRERDTDRQSGRREGEETENSGVFSSYKDICPMGLRHYSMNSFIFSFMKVLPHGTVPLRIRDLAYEFEGKVMQSKTDI
jgi:hypothetical protein